MGAICPDNDRRDRMTVTEAAERLAEIPRGGGREVKLLYCRRTGKAVRRTVLHPDVKRWKRKLYEAAELGELPHRKGLYRNSRLLFSWADIDSWWRKDCKWKVTRGR